MILTGKIFFVVLLKHSDDKAQLKHVLETRTNEKVALYEQFRENFFEMIRDRKQQYEDLKAKDAESAKKIDEQMEKIKTITVIFD